MSFVEIYKEYPLTVFPSVAKELGLAHAVILQEIEYALHPRYGRPVRLGRHWINNTPEEWESSFPFLSLPEIKEVLENLWKKGLLLKGQYPSSEMAWYTVNYDNDLIKKLKGL